MNSSLQSINSLKQKLTGIWRSLNLFKKWVHIHIQKKELDYVSIFKFLGIFVSNKVSFCESCTSTIFQTRHWIGTYVISKSLWSGKIKRMTNFCWGHLFRILFTVSNIYIYYYTFNLVILYSTFILYVAVVQIYGIFRQIFGFSYKMYRRLNHYFERNSC